nr:MAG TPA: hypothetical protein [Caudoviricetes sp.]DAW51511.1 MAG TPA: hypothetical protein [Caudoviricetes sp.]
MRYSIFSRFTTIPKRVVRISLAMIRKSSLRR